MELVSKGDMSIDDLDSKKRKRDHVYTLYGTVEEREIDCLGIFPYYMSEASQH